MLYTKGLTIELTDNRTVTNPTANGGKHEHNSLNVNITKAGSQNTSDTATTIKNVLDIRKVFSVDAFLRTPKSWSGAVFCSLERIVK